MSSGREAEAAAEFGAAVRLTPNDPTIASTWRLLCPVARPHGGRDLRSIERPCGPTPTFRRRTLNLGLLSRRCPAVWRMRSRSIGRRSRSTRRPVRSEPDLWEAHFNLGLAYATNGRPGGRRNSGIPGPALRLEARFRIGRTSTWETRSTRWAGWRRRSRSIRHR